MAVTAVQLPAGLVEVETRVVVYPIGVSCHIGVVLKIIGGLERLELERQLRIGWPPRRR